ncbi:alkaline phosphatase [Brevibacterium luteolum]|uniref:alkaline phosphatase D family protein n=1 Tax=Brevibacterium luteolum TaxID=199591 RepID=UPI00349FC1E8
MGNFRSPARRTLLKGAAAASLAAAVPSAASAAPTRPSPSRPSPSRLPLPSGIQTGDVTMDSAVLWSRASGGGRLHAVLHALDPDGRRLTASPARRGTGRGRDGEPIALRGPWATSRTDFTARISAKDLPSDTEYEVELFFEDENGTRGEIGTGRFGTAPGHRSDGAQSFIWTADTAGQGYGINSEVGGMFGYETMRALEPDFILHAGDTIYADGPIEESIEEPDGTIWHNVVSEEVAKVAETLREFRGRHSYNLLDENIRAMYAEVPVIATWDDHETTNNWWPGEVLEDERYSVVDVDTLAVCARRAWQEYQPIADVRSLAPGTGFEPERIYRKISRGR